MGSDPAHFWARFCGMPCIFVPAQEPDLGPHTTGVVENTIAPFHLMHVAR